MNDDKLKELIKKLRKRMINYWIANVDEGNSMHIGAIEIVIALVTYSLDTNPARKITVDEETSWFKAGFYIDQILGNSPWSDISDMYYELIGEVKRRNYFR